MKEITDILLRRIVDSIVHAVDPFQIVLFGSTARGDAGPRSDLDLLVVVPGSFDGKRSRTDMYADLMSSLPRRSTPVDLLLFTRTEVREWRPFRNHVISRAFREGRVIYEKAQARSHASAKSPK
jgi:predicted nucleotidyltransferase